MSDVFGKGYVSIHREIMDHWLWQDKPFSKGQAWVDLLILAQGVNREKEYRGKVQHMKPGNVYTSILYLSKRWGWGRAKIYRFLDTLINLGMIAVQGWTQNDTTERTRNGTTNGTIITIENWALYQDHDATDDTPNDTTKRTRNDTHNRKHIRECTTEKANRNKPPKSPLKGDSSPSGDPVRGTDEFRNRSHVLLKEDEGTVDDIPVNYREMFDNFSEYWRYRNQ